MDESDPDFLRVAKWLEEAEPTDEDVRTRVVTDEQARELCLRIKCRVMMNWWNPVNDVKKRLLEQDRWHNKTPHDALRLLAKGVNRHKPACLYDDESVELERRDKWRERKKENLMWLDLWEYDRKQAAEKKQKEAAIELLFPSEENNKSMAAEVNNNSMAAEVNNNSMAAEENNKSMAAEENNNSMDESMICEFDNVNTESMSAQPNTEDLLAENFLSSESQPVLSQDFAMELPLTSTQKQTQSQNV